MSESSTGPDPLDDLAEEFLARWRLGERPSLSEYTANFPELAERIRSVFPALLVMLEFGSEAGRPPDPHVVFPRSESEGPTRLGEYLLLRRVGSGGMGIVYEAIQESLGRHVALKTLPSQHGSDGTWLERFQREARAAARLHHNNIVPVYGIGEHDGLHYYTMQFIRGHGLDVVLREVKRLRGDPNASDAAAASGGLIESISLANELQTGRFPSAKAESTQRVEPSVNGRLADRVIASRRGETASLSSELSDRSGLSEQPEAQYVHSIARVGALVASALDYAHQQGVLHRDIKPANLMLDAQGQIWITDFGLAKAEGSDELTRTGDIVGTLRYMAPERFNGWSDRRSDVYALGATLYELLSLRPAFEESDRIKLIDQIVQQSPCLLRQIDRRIPRDLETIVLKSLAKEPGDRYPTAGQLAEDLHRFVEGRPILARRSGVAERLWRWSKRNRLLAAAAGAATAALVAVAVISLIFATEQARANRENRRLAHELGQKSDRLKDSLADSTRLLAIRNFDRGQAAFDKGQIGAGLHWMIESWRAAVDAGDRDRQHAARTSLAAWQSHHARLKAVFSHGSPVAAAAFSPDSKFVLTASADRTAQLWNVGTGKPIGKPMLHPGAVLTVAFSPNGTTVVTGCTDGVARLWDITTFRTVGLPLIHAGAVNAVAFSPDGNTILTGSSDRTARLWSAATQKPIGLPAAHNDAVRAVAFSHDGKTILTGGDDVLARFWDAATGELLGAPIRHRATVNAAAVVPEGGASDDLRLTHEVLNKVHAVAYCPDGKTVLTGCKDGTVQAWDAASRGRVGQAMKHRFKVRAVAISPDGKTILVGSEDKMARLWDAVTQQPIGQPVIHHGPVGAVAFSPDGTSFLTASSDNTVRLWDASPGNPSGRIAEHKDAGHVVAFGHDGKSILTGHFDGTARHSTVTSGELIGHTIRHQGPVMAVATSSDGSKLLTGSFDKTVRIWDSKTGNQVGPVLQHAEEVNVVAFSPDGKTIMTGSEDPMLRLWDASSGRLLCIPIPQSNAIDAGAFSPDGKSVVVGCASGLAQMWDLATRVPVGPPFPHPGCISAAAFSPDGRTLLTGCEDGAARLWDLETRTLRVPALLHESWIWAVAFSPDGKLILTGSRDRTARLWDAATGVPLGPPIVHPHEVWSVAFSSDGNCFMTGAYDYVARVSRKAPELADDLERVATWVGVLTGLSLDAQKGSIEVLDNVAWRASRVRLSQLGGAPTL